MIYLDSCIVIYAVEDVTARGEAVRDKLRRTEATVAVSSLVIHECLVGPLQVGDLELRERYLAVLGRMRQVDLDLDVYIRAAELRAASGLRAPDALHLAAAQRAGCEALWTNDKRLVAVSRGLAIDVLTADHGPADRHVL